VKTKSEEDKEISEASGDRRNQLGAGAGLN